MVGARLREIRERNGLTQRYVAHRICSIGMLSKVERGLANPS